MPRPRCALRHLGSGLFLLAASLVAVLLPSPVVAPPVATAATTSPQVDVVLEGLYNPRGLTVGPDGAVYVAEAGRGGERAVKAGFYQVPFNVGRTARVTRITPAGEWQIILDGLPSVKTPDDIFGAAAVTFVGEDLFVLTAAGGRDVGEPGYDNQILKVGVHGDVEPVVNLTALNYQSPPLARLQDLRADVEGGVPFGMTSLNGRLYTTDSNLETVTEVALDGSTRRLVELPASNRVLVGLTGAPDGSLWVAEYGPIPHQKGGAKISRLTVDGELTVAWPGLTEAIGIAFGPDGSAYALEFASRGRLASSGRLIRRWPDGHLELLLSGLNYPTALACAPDGSLFVSESGHNAENGTGRVLHVQLPPE